VTAARAIGAGRRRRAAPARPPPRRMRRPAGEQLRRGRIRASQTDRASMGHHAPWPLLPTLDPGWSLIRGTEATCPTPSLDSGRVSCGGGLRACPPLRPWRGWVGVELRRQEVRKIWSGAICFWWRGANEFGRRSCAARLRARLEKRRREHGERRRSRIQAAAGLDEIRP
jgi:hypothetical protein